MRTSTKALMFLFASFVSFVSMQPRGNAKGPEFTSTWKAPEAAGVSFTGRKIAALVMTTDENLRVSSEEQLVRELAARKMDGVATYKMMPREEAATAERARPWYERAGVTGVVALRPVAVDREKVYTPSVWVTSSYSTLWGYYGYGWTTVSGIGGSSRTDTRVVIETLVYSMPLDKLLWAGVSTATNPKETQAFVKELVAEAVKEMKKQGLVK